MYIKIGSMLAWVAVGFAITFSALNVTLTYHPPEGDMSVCRPY